jgi:radical SAM protein with 4Fe4S-binding SPASM domain
LVNFDNFIQDLGVTGNLSFYTPVGHGAGQKDFLSMRDIDIKEYTRLLSLKKRNFKIEEYSQNKDERLPTKFNCSAGINMLGIEHDGRVVPCHLFLGKDLSLGNILTESLYDMQKRWINDMVKIVDNNEECNKCSIKHFCGNGCFANNYYNNAKFYGKDPNCTVYKAGIENRLWNLTN